MPSSQVVLAERRPHRSFAAVLRHFARRCEPFLEPGRRTAAYPLRDGGKYLFPATKGDKDGFVVTDRDVRLLRVSEYRRNDLGWCCPHDYLEPCSAVGCALKRRFVVNQSVDQGKAPGYWFTPMETIPTVWAAGAGAFVDLFLALTGSGGRAARVVWRRRCRGGRPHGLRLDRDERRGG